MQIIKKKGTKKYSKEPLHLVNSVKGVNICNVESR